LPSFRNIAFFSPSFFAGRYAFLLRLEERTFSSSGFLFSASRRDLPPLPARSDGMAISFSFPSRSNPSLLFFFLLSLGALSRLLCLRGRRRACFSFEGRSAGFLSLSGGDPFLPFRPWLSPAEGPSFFLFPFPLKGQFFSPRRRLSTGVPAILSLSPSFSLKRGGTSFLPP